LTWVDQVLPGTFDWLAIGGVEGAAVNPDPLSNLRAGVVPGQGMVLSGLASGGQAAPRPASAVSADPVSADPVSASGVPAAPAEGAASDWQPQSAPAESSHSDWQPQP